MLDLMLVWGDSCKFSESKGAPLIIITALFLTAVTCVVGLLFSLGIGEDHTRS